MFGTPEEGSMAFLAAVSILALLALVTLLVYGAMVVQRERPARWLSWGVAVAAAFFVGSAALMVWSPGGGEHPPAAAAGLGLLAEQPAAVAPDPYESVGPPVAAQGRKLYLSSGCARCHTIGAGALVGPDLINVSSRYSEAFLVRWIVDPEGIYRELGVAVVNPDFPPMPATPIGDEAALRIAQYLRSFPAEGS